MGTNKVTAPMRALSERLVANYEIVVTEKDAEKLPLTEIQDWPEDRWRRGRVSAKCGEDGTRRNQAEASIQLQPQ